jgi:hypothetical protein
MGRQSRQARRAQERRAQHQRRRQSQQTRFTFNWQVVAGLAVVLAVAGILGFKALSGTSASTNSATSTSTIPAGPPVMGIGCDQGMPAGGYHVHAHLAVYVKGKPFTIGSDSGHYYAKDCLYWLHAHDSIGIIHIEAPHPTQPPLGAYLEILGKTNPSGAPPITPAPGQSRKVWVNGQPYAGDPAKIPLKLHENIQIDIGPPFTPYQPFDFKAHGY